MELTADERKRLENFLKKHSLTLERPIASGFSSKVFLVRDKLGRRYALKLERSDSCRQNMLEREVENLKLANKYSIGPKLFAWDASERAVLLEYVEGKTLDEWVFGNVSRKTLLAFLSELLYQVTVLDKLGLDHGQLKGRGTNIIVRNNKPVIIDFEKASRARKAHNFNTVFAYLFLNPKSRIKKRIAEILQSKDSSSS